MFDARFDESLKLVTISYARHVGEEDARHCAERLQLLLPELPPGFRLLTDLSRLESMDLACVPYIKQMMDLCNQGGVGTVVRVIPDPRKDIGLNIMSLFHYRRGVRFVTCKKLEEAMQALGAGKKED